MEGIPNLIILLSGKRKSGKDFLAERLVAEFSNYRRTPRNSSAAAENDSTTTTTATAIILRISAPLKMEYARILGLSFDRLSDSSSYKEEFRRAMVEWSDEIRRRDPYYFCRLTASSALDDDFKAQTWIVSDIRRPADIRYFEENFEQKKFDRRVRLIKIRVEASETIRSQRGWRFEAGIDDAETECALDDTAIRWDFVFANDGDDFETNFRELIDRIGNWGDRGVGGIS